MRVTLISSWVKTSNLQSLRSTQLYRWIHWIKRLSQSQMKMTRKICRFNESRMCWTKEAVGSTESPQRRISKHNLSLERQNQCLFKLNSYFLQTSRLPDQKDHPKSLHSLKTKAQIMKKKSTWFQSFNLIDTTPIRVTESSSPPLSSVNLLPHSILRNKFKWIYVIPPRTRTR
jgi:hypothetical protein